MSATRAFRLPPAGRRFGIRELGTLLAADEAPARLEGALSERLDVSQVTLFASGREALRMAFLDAAEETGRHEVVLPAYTCFSVAAAAVAAGLRVRLVDVTPDGAIDPDALAKLPLERAAAVVACNLFGFAEPLHEIAPRVQAAGARLVDDAAQSLGARDGECQAGTRGDVGILSFGRGKPLSGLGGGAQARTRAHARDVAAAAGQPFQALLHGLAYDLALSPRLFGWLAAIPTLGIGETPFETRFSHGGIASDRAALAHAVFQSFDADQERRVAVATTLAARIAAETKLRPLAPAKGCTGVYPRLACLATDAAGRHAAVMALERVGAGVSTMYPSALGAIPGLALQLEGPRDLPGARALAERILTLPTHGQLSGARLEAALQALRDGP